MGKREIKHPDKQVDTGAYSAAGRNGRMGLRERAMRRWIWPPAR